MLSTKCASKLVTSRNYFESNFRNHNVRFVATHAHSPVIVD